MLYHNFVIFRKVDFLLCPFAVKINVALKEQNCQKISSERVKNKEINTSMNKHAYEWMNE